MLFTVSLMLFILSALMLMTTVNVLIVFRSVSFSGRSSAPHLEPPEPASAPSMTLDEYFRIWLNNRNGVIAPSTAYNNEKCYAVISRFLGSEHLDAITSAAVTTFRQQLCSATILRNGADTGKHYSVRTIREEMALLSSILKSAAQEGLIEKNPCVSVRPVRDSSAASIRDGAHRALTDREIRTFFTEAEGSWYCPLFTFLMQTGCRAGEAAALTWDDIDLKGHTVYIHRTLEQTGSGQWIISDSPKTASSVRRVHLSREAAAALKLQRSQNAETAGKYPDAPAVARKLVFSSTRGGYVSRNHINTAILSISRRICKNGGTLAVFSSHAFRHTFATKCVEQGMTPEVLKGILGHSDIKMTMGTYYHLSQERMNRAMAKMKIQ